MLKKGETLSLPIELKQTVRTSSLLIENATKGADVWIDGKFAGSIGEDGSFRLGEISPVEHDVTLKKTNFEDKLLRKSFTVGQPVQITGEEGQLTPFGVLDFGVLPPSASVTYQLVGEAQTHTAASGKVSVRAGRYVVAVEAGGYATRRETVAVESGKTLPIGWSLTLLATGPATKEPVPPPKQTPTKDYFRDPAAWTQSGEWWVHKAGVSWLKGSQGVYVIEILRPTSKKAFLLFKKAAHVEWIIQDQENSANQIDYTFDFKNLERRATVNGKAEQKVNRPVATGSGDSYTIRIEIRQDQIVIRDAQQQLYVEKLGKFGFKGEVALVVKSGPEQ